MAKKKNDEEKNELEILFEIRDKLNDVITLFSVNDKERDEKIKIMASKGYSNRQISELLGIQKGTVDGI
ncbi:MAG: hypothetical protein PVF83_06520 [Anaerolineales bacterium]|jgi:hypothetical protein